MAALLRLRAACKSIIHTVLQRRGYLEVDTPILTTTDCEGAGETFLVTPTSSKMLAVGALAETSPTPVHLTVSAQLHLEALALGLSKVYTLSPTFRAEPSHSRFHLAEFYMLEAESVTMCTTETLCDEIEAIVHDIASPFLDRIVSGCPRMDLDLVLSHLANTSNIIDSETHLKRLESAVTKPFERMSYVDAVAFLERYGKRTSDRTGGFNKEEEQALCSGVGAKCVFVTDFPATTKPFYCADSPNTKAVCCVDLLVPGVGELVGGSVREARRDALLNKMAVQGVKEDSMTWYAELRRHGGAPHGGFGLGFDRLLMWTLGVYNVRDTVLFPRELKKVYL